MAEQTAESDTAARRTVWTHLVRRAPFRLLLQGCTIEGIRAAAATASLPRSYRLKCQGDVVTVKYYGFGVYNTSWSIKAHLTASADGVLLEGHHRYLAGRIRDGLIIAFPTILLCIAAWLGLSEGLGSDVAGCLGAAVVMGLVAAFNLMWLPGAIAKREERAEQLFRDAFEEPARIPPVRD